MTTTALKPKQRILASAARLFYTSGINNVGVDTISKEAGVSKRTLYRYFSSKDSLVAGYLNTTTGSWLKGYVSEETTDPAQRIISIFQSLKRASQKADFCGCPFMNASVELRAEDGTAKQSARDGKKSLYEFFFEELKRLAVKNPAQTAEQLVVLFDGTNAWIVMHGVFPESTLNTLTAILNL